MWKYYFLVSLSLTSFRKLYRIHLNPCIKEFAVCIYFNINNKKIYDIIQQYEIDIIIIGLEAPLVDVFTDFLWNKQVKVCGRLLCERHSIPQPEFKFYFLFNLKNFFNKSLHSVALIPS